MRVLTRIVKVSASHAGRDSVIYLVGKSCSDGGNGDQPEGDFEMEDRLGFCAAGRVCKEMPRVLVRTIGYISEILGAAIR